MAFVYTVVSDKDTHFTTALAQNASESENLLLPTALDGVNGNARSIIRGITVISDQNLDWQLVFFNSDTFVNADIDLNTAIASYKFTASTDALQVGGSGSYYYFKDGLNLPYLDADNTGELHVLLVNRSATGKNAGATGEVVIKVHMEPPGFGVNA